MNMLDLGRVGVWAGETDRCPSLALRQAAAAIEDLGYPALWFPEAVRVVAFHDEGQSLASSLPRLRPPRSRPSTTEGTYQATATTPSPATEVSRSLRGITHMAAAG
ncbi:hypothetical protein [Nonomuraea angiospora]